MDYGNIIAGLNPGGANKVYEARILICYLLDFLKVPLSKNDINNILQHYGLVNYFTFSQAFDDLIKNNHVADVCETQSSDNGFDNNYPNNNFNAGNNNNDNIKNNKLGATSEIKYILTENGIETAKVFQNTIASTVKKKISDSANQYLKNIKLLEDHVVQIEKVKDGYIVHCRVKDIGSDLINLSIFSPDKDTAKLIKKNFVNHSFELYQYIFDFLTLN